MNDFQPMQVNQAVISAITQLVKDELLKSDKKNILLDGLKCYDYPLYTSMKNVETKLREYNGTEQLQQFITDFLYTLRANTIKQALLKINLPLEEEQIKVHFINGSVIFVTKDDLDMFVAKHYPEGIQSGEDIERNFWSSKYILIVDNLDMEDQLKMKLQSFLHDLQYCMEAGLTRASLLLMRGVMIAVMANHAQHHPEGFRSSGLKDLPFGQWPIAALIKQAIESNTIKVVNEDLFSLIRLLNNYDNPYEEQRNHIEFKRVQNLFHLLDNIIRQLESGQLALKI